MGEGGQLAQIVAKDTHQQEHKYWLQGGPGKEKTKIHMLPLQLLADKSCLTWGCQFIKLDHI